MTAIKWIRILAKVALQIVKMNLAVQAQERARTMTLRALGTITVAMRIWMGKEMVTRILVPQMAQVEVVPPFTLTRKV